MPHDNPHVVHLVPWIRRERRQRFPLEAISPGRLGERLPRLRSCMLSRLYCPGFASWTLLFACDPWIGIAPVDVFAGQKTRALRPSFQLQQGL